MAAALLYSSLVFISLLFSLSEATEFLVGGKADAWKVPSSETESLNKWAQSSRFKVGDSLVWKLDGKNESAVLRVTKEDYTNCNVTNPIAEYTNGSTKVELDRSGPFYFISGVKGNCEKGQKVIVVVLSSKSVSGISSPAPSPMGFDGSSAVPPTSGSSSLRSGSCFLGASMVLVMSLVKMMGFLL